MFVVKLLTILLTAVLWTECIHFETAWSMDTLISRSKRQSPPSCGVRVPQEKKMGRIFGGAKSRDKWPWMVALWLRRGGPNGGYFHVCGGSVINARHVLTAAHCLETGADPKSWIVQVGELSLTSTNSRYRIEALKAHERYSGKPTFHNDIAIMRLATPLPSGFVPVCLPVKDSLKEGDRLTTLGWGQLSKGSNYVVDLQEIHDIQMMSSARCKSRFPHVINSQFCAVDSASGKKGACKGDSGGPVMTRNSAGQYEVVGVVSSGLECQGGLVVNTKVNAYMPWIQQAVQSSG